MLLNPLMTAKTLRLFPKLFILLTVGVTNAYPQADFLTLQNRVVEIYNENQTSVVRINSLYERVDENGETQQDIRVATGFFVSKLGHILTTRSVVFEAKQVWIEHNRVAYPAQVVGEDRRNNVALLKADILPSDFTFIRLDDSDEQPPIASMVIAISLPLEFNPTPSFGLITGYESSVYRIAFQTTHLRTNIFFGLGEGGTPVLDLNGRLVGMNVATLLDIPSSYILPTRALFRIRDDLMFGGEVVYSWFGIEGRETTEIIRGSRVVVDEVVPGGPAEDVGILAGDRLLEIGEFMIQTPSDVRNARFFARVGRYIRVKVLRDDEERIFSLKVAAVPPEELAKKADTEVSSGEGKAEATEDK